MCNQRLRSNGEVVQLKEKGSVRMLHDHLVALFKEMGIEGAVIPRDSVTISLEFEGKEIVVTDTPPGMEISATICAVPEEEQEILFTKLLRGNFLGQTTRRARLGLDEEASYVVLLVAIPMIRSYREFRDTIEDFVNVLSFWSKELS